MAALGAQSQSVNPFCLPTDVQLLSSKALRVLVLVEDENASLVGDLRGWARYDAVAEGGGEVGLPTLIKSCPIPEWVTTDRRTERLHTLLTCTFNLASLLYMLFETMETISPKLKSWLSTVYKTNVERSFARVKPISDRRKVSLCFLADKWRDNMAGIAEADEPPDEPADELPDEPPAELAKETPREPPKINADDLRRLHEVAYLGPEKSQTMWFANRHHPMVADWHVPALSS